eukprot:comp12879_c1_seq1/m.8066 comp12879_c1_seq1/g.8066  ORF comp12879_c1_seq1/g.8066 comp12879_c1_seq1/m.8066 type:complete len:490 (-) comp12879_c1_seq1:203-1672(-)
MLTHSLGPLRRALAARVLHRGAASASSTALTVPTEFVRLATAKAQGLPSPERPSFYRRNLPEPPAVAFAKPDGRRMFAEALADGTMDCFFPLIEQFRTQDEPAFCGLAALTMVLNALAIDPRRTWKGPWRWFHERLLDCCSPVEEVEKKGMVFRQLVCLARCNGALVRAHQAGEVTEAQFREDVLRSCTEAGVGGFVLAGYSRKEFLQTGDGHYSPIGGYHRASDSVLILDVARFKYPPHWVPLGLLWKSMHRLDPDTGMPRGYMVLKKQDDSISLVFTMSRQQLSRCNSLCNLDRSVTAAMQAAYDAATTGDQTNNTLLVSNFLRRMPDKLRKMLSTYSAEYKLSITEGPVEYQQAAAGLLASLRSLPIYGTVLDVVRGGSLPTPQLGAPDTDAGPHERMSAVEWSSAYHSILLLSIPPSFWTQLQDRHVREYVLKLLDVSDSPAVQREVGPLRLQLAELLTFDSTAKACQNSNGCAHARQACSHHPH